jgi:ATP-dependent Clp endopeptidase proteolytic subunit ClpP
VGAKEKKKEPAEVVEEKPEAEEPAEEEGLSQQPMIMVMQAPSSGGDKDEDKIRCLGLIGDINEEKSSETMYGILSLRNAGKREVLVDEDKPDGEIKTEQLPFEMIISTHGGNASDMFGIYDLMRDTMEQGCEIHTFALGKVMSAGVLLMAAGTKGKRRIGRHCRVMIHGVAAGAGGQIQDIDNEMGEIKLIQDQYITSLAKESAMTKTYIKNLLKKKLNVYISAEEAVDLGIADTIV